MRGEKRQSATNSSIRDKDEIGSFDRNQTPLELLILGIGKGAEIGAAVLLELNGSAYIPVHDHNGSVTVLISPDNQLTEGVRYTAFGEEERYLLAGNPWRFASKRVDPETGFIYFGNRYYSPRTHRWITSDPVGYDEGPNLYAYLANNPLNQFDQRGLRAERDRFEDRRDPGRGTSFSSARDRIKESRDYEKNFILSTIETMIQTVVPVPLIRDIFEVGNRILTGIGIGGYSFQKGKSYNFITDNGDFKRKIVITKTNGILTSDDYFTAAM